MRASAPDRAVDLLAVDPKDRAAAAPSSVAAGADLDELGLAAAGCRSCPLWEQATQTVFGEGPIPARLMLVGEQPGDQEDRQGKPFVGPAGHILDRAFEAAGIDRERVFLTNVVKHFKWRPDPRSKRRLHERPSRAEVVACQPWVEAELALVRPQALVLLGAVAATALAGLSVRVTRDRGRPLESNLAPLVVVTIHPSAVLRAGDADDRATAFDGLVADLRKVVTVLDAGAARSARA
jgi:uracil-DNA glycosylase